MNDPNVFPLFTGPIRSRVRTGKRGLFATFWRQLPFGTWCVIFGLVGLAGWALAFWHSVSEAMR